ncbi:MAG TPA: ATP-binding cassette domain-containing protein [Streptosporangiaceae bacterium]|nr:ATP-binding cassette domain-containing protein [Streptosporangiaceae bacterium]
MASGAAPGHHRQRTRPHAGVPQEPGLRADEPAPDEGIIRRDRDEHDSRLVRLYVTPAGRERAREWSAAYQRTVSRLLQPLSSVAVIWFGGRLVSEGSMPIGNLTAFLTYIMQMLIAVMMAVMMVILVPRAVASAERIEQVVTTVPAITDPPRPLTPARVTGTVEFRDVSFGYPGSERPVLHGLAFTLRPGRTSAIIGGTGSGKTTLLNLIPRFFDATSGTVLVNETDVREQLAEQLWSSIGIIPQTAFLFSGTVASNLRLGRPEATEAELWRALEVAQARDFVASSQGSSTPLSTRAAAMSPAVSGSGWRSPGHWSGGTHQQLLMDCAPYREIVASQLGEGAAA